MRVSLIMSTREFTSSIVIFALNGLALKLVLIQIRSLESALIRVVMLHWKCCNCLHTPRSRDLQRVHDKGRKDLFPQGSSPASESQMRFLFCSSTSTMRSYMKGLLLEQQAGSPRSWQQHLKDQCCRQWQHLRCDAGQ